MTIKEEKTQYELIQAFLTNNQFHFNHSMIKGIIKFLYDKFGSEFWKYIVEDNSDLFESFRKYTMEEGKIWYHFKKEQLIKDKEQQRSFEKRQKNKELDEEEIKYRLKHPNAWGH